MDKKVKNALATVGAVSLVAAASALVAGVALGAVLANPEKAKNTAKDIVCKAKIGLAKYGVLDIVEEECECCKGGTYTCENEGQCACEGEPEEIISDVEPVTEEPKAAVHYEEPHCGELS